MNRRDRIDNGLPNLPFSSADDPIEIPPSVPNQLHRLCQLRRDLGVRRRRLLRVVSRQQKLFAEDHEILRRIPRDECGHRAAVVRKENTGMMATKRKAGPRVPDSTSSLSLASSRNLGPIFLTILYSANDVKANPSASGVKTRRSAASSPSSRGEGPKKRKARNVPRRVTGRGAAPPASRRRRRASGTAFN